MNSDVSIDLESLSKSDSFLQQLRMAFPRHAMMRDDSPWPLHLLHIFFGYALVIIPTWLFIRHIRNKYKDPLVEGQGRWTRWSIAFAVGIPEYNPLGDDPDKRQSVTHERGSFFKDGGMLLWYFTGIQACMVSMGYLQERIITRGYQRNDNDEQFDRFGDAQFLVFCNRMVALGVVAVVLLTKSARLRPHAPPYYKNAYASLSNTISSWCQYEALKYVSFPTQTICKASKVVATMLMGTIVGGKKYSASEYMVGGGIAIGGSLFFLSSSDTIVKGAETTTTLSGIILMIGYLCFDAFTPVWQKKLLDHDPPVCKNQMMLAVNLFSSILCVVSLVEQGTFWESLSFAFSHTNFATDAFLLSLSNAIGQLFIYATIDKFGPIVLAVIMTIRQMISIIVSSISYGHPITWIGLIGFCIVFGCIFIDSYRKYKNKK